MAISVRNLNKSFDDVSVLKDIDFDVEDDEILAILGKSGSGKSTLLRIIAGLAKADSGEILIDGKDSNLKTPSQRKISMIFQDYALYPHMNVENNILFPYKKEKSEIVENLAIKLGIQKLLKSYPGNLSGGEAQRVAIARSLINEKNLFLLDEPFANLDSVNKSIMRSEVLKLHNEVKKPFIIVTHDIIDALTLSDKIMLIINGEIVQYGKTKEVYKSPKTLEALSLMTKEEINTFSADEFENNLYLKSTGININKNLIKNDFSNGSKDIILAFKADSLDLYNGENSGLILNAKINNYDYYGSKLKINFEISENPISMLASSKIKLKLDKDVKLFVPYDQIFLYPSV